MLRLQRASSEQTHEEVFLERYQRLYTWLLQFTDGDRDLAWDLVQDVCSLHLHPSRPRRNSQPRRLSLRTGAQSHLSQMRHAVNARVQQLSVIDYDSGELALRTIDVRDQIQVHDELRRICRYACVRKDSASGERH